MQLRTTHVVEFKLTLKTCASLRVIKLAMEGKES